MEGFWTAHFSTPVGLGAGVAYFRNSRVYGGDGGYTYLGKYEQKGDQLLADIRVSPFIEGTPSVFGSIGQAFDLTVTGTVTELEVSGTGMSDMFPGVQFAVALKRVE